MLLTITTTHRPASDLGYLLHKHPDRCQSFDLSFGKAHVFYPEVGAERCSACLLLDVDPVGMMRRKNASASFLLAQYVNDGPYAEPGVQREVGDARGRTISPSRPPLRVDAAGVSGLGAGHRRAVRIHGTVRGRGACGGKAGTAYTDGDFREMTNEA